MSKQIPVGLAFFLMLFLLLVFSGMPALAFDVRGGDKVAIASGEVVNDDLYIAGETVLIDGIINGDLWAFGRAIIISGEVKGSILAAAESINISAYSVHTVRAACRSLDISGDIDGDVIVGAAEVNIASTATITGDLLFGAGKTRIDGLIDSDVLGGAGTVHIGNGVKGNVKLRVGEITLSSSSNIKGDLTYISEKKANIQEGALIAGSITHKLPMVKARKKGSPVAPFLGIIPRIMFFLMALITGLVILLLAPKRLRSISESIGISPWPSLGWGAVILFATPPAALTVFFTIVGIPLVFIALALYGIAVYLSQIPVGLFIGSWIIGRYSKVENKSTMFCALALGLFIQGLLRLIPFLRFFVTVAIILLGLGAIIVSEKKRRVMPEGFSLSSQ
jgi:cytoskeletal protein CcmA (bactofilin family)